MVAAEPKDSENWNPEKDALDGKEVAVAVMDHDDKAAEESQPSVAKPKRLKNASKAGKAGKD